MDVYLLWNRDDSHGDELLGVYATYLGAENERQMQIEFGTDEDDLEIQTYTVQE